MRLPILRLMLTGLMVALAVAGCGQKGNLYLPEKSSAIELPRAAVG